MASTIKNPVVTVSPTVTSSMGTAQVSVYRDRKGNLYVREFGAKLTSAEKKKGLTPAKTKLAKAVKQFYSETDHPERLGYKLKFTRSGAGIEKTKYLRPATINGRAGWFDTRNGKFLFKEQRFTDENRVNVWGEKWKQYGTMQLNLRSADNTAYGMLQVGSLEEFYLYHLNAKEKSKLNEALNALNWQEDVYDHFESSDPSNEAPAGRPNKDEEQKGYEKVLNVIKATVGDKWRAYVESLGGALA